MKANVVLSLVVVGGLSFTTYQSMGETTAKSTPKTLTAAESKAALKKWETSPDGIQFKNWEASPVGKKVQAGAAKIRKFVRTNANMQGIVTSLSLPEGSRLGYGLLVKIDREDYILSLGQLSKAELAQLKSLKVNDKIVIRSRFVSKAPKYAYPIVNGDYLEKDSKVVYKRVAKGGC
ncbi:MAG: hypothetical protein RLZZ96_1598 [Bacteroidota bacterium]|jgi:hypothetical protein